MKTLPDVVSSSGPEVIRLRSRQLEVEVAPGLGGRIVQIRHLDSGHEFLWNNAGLTLAAQPPGSPYDSNFYGGIDELIPNDIPETIDGVACPDHGELWTSPLDWHLEEDTLFLRGRLPRFGLAYERRMTLRHDSPVIDLHYRIANKSEAVRHFLWKHHAAMTVATGDVIDCPARKAQVVDLTYSRFDWLSPFSWPEIEGQQANIVPAKNNTVDFFYLFDLAEGRIAWARPSQRTKFEYRFDTSVFPFVWLFASYGGFDGHYTVVLEPCTAMPMSVNDAIANGRCSQLGPGEVLETDVSIYAGPFE
ncbi:MAG: hypothetical protein WD468_07580 [Pirellulales bacterium]